MHKARVLLPAFWELDVRMCVHRSFKQNDQSFEVQCGAAAASHVYHTSLYGLCAFAVKICRDFCQLGLVSADCVLLVCSWLRQWVKCKLGLRGCCSRAGGLPGQGSKG